MPTYETLFITTPNLTEDEENTTVDVLAKLVSDGGGEMVANERLGRRRLAYPIRKFTDGVYVRFLYDAEAAVPKELERRIRISDRVLRSLTVRLEPDWAAEAKVQAVRDAEARVEAAKREAEEQAREAEKAAEEARVAAAAPATAPEGAAEGAEGGAEDAGTEAAPAGQVSGEPAGENGSDAATKE